MRKIIIVLVLSFFLFSCGNDSNQWRQNVNDNIVEDNEPLDAIDAEFEKEYAKIVEEEQIDEDYKLVRELEDLEEDKKVWKKAKWSCNKQTPDWWVCLEYYGSFWSEQQMKLNCKWGGTFSYKICPRTMDWWCNTWVGTQLDNVLWMYRLWESKKSAIKVCNASGVSRWITTK